MEKEMFRKQLNDQQKAEMNQVNLRSMHEKRQRDDNFVKGLREEQGLNPAYLGNGYQKQLAFMNEAERLNNISLKHYQDRVAS
jgi:hypothetical protein